MGCISAKLTGELVAKLWKLTAIQALALAQAGDLRPAGMMGGTYRELHACLREVSPALTADRPLFEDITRITGLLQRADVQARFLQPRPESHG